MGRARRGSTAGLVLIGALLTPACADPLRRAQAELVDRCEAAAHDPAERAALEAELRGRTRVVVRARALSSAELAARTGTRLYREDVVLLVYDQLDHGHPSYQSVTELSLRAGGQDYASLRGEQLWTHAGLEPPTPATRDPNYDERGAAVDLFVAILTVGAVDLKRRKTESWSGIVEPGRAGTATPEQLRAIALIGASQGREYPESYVGDVEHRVRLLAPPERAEAGDALELVLRTTLYLGSAGHDAKTVCPFVLEERFEVPAVGADGSALVGDRLQAVFDRHGELVLGSAKP